MVAYLYFISLLSREFYARESRMKYHEDLKMCIPVCKDGEEYYPFGIIPSRDIETLTKG